MEMTYSKEMREFMRLHDLAHKKGDAKAAFQLANILLKMQKPSLDKAAIKYLELAIKHAWPDAFIALGKCYETGTGVAEDIMLAIDWYKRVDGALFEYFLAHPDPPGEAMSECLRYINDIYMDGGDEADALDEYFENLEREHSFRNSLPLAKSGDADAQYRVACGYLHGNEDVEKDRKKAVYWLERSAEGGCSQAMEKFAGCCEEDNELKKAEKWYYEYAKCRLQWFHDHLREIGRE